MLYSMDREQESGGWEEHHLTRPKFESPDLPSWETDADSFDHSSGVISTRSCRYSV